MAKQFKSPVYKTVSHTKSRSNSFLMRPKITKLLKLVLTATLAFALVMPGFSLAQDKDKKERKTKQTVAMSQAVYESLQEIQELVELTELGKLPA